jgi:hypothetical protein
MGRGRAIPTHIRWLVIDWSYRSALSATRIVELFVTYGISVRTVRRIRRCFRLYADVWEPRHYTSARGNPGQLLSADEKKEVIDYIAARADVYQDEIVEFIRRYVRAAAPSCCCCCRC